MTVLTTAAVQGQGTPTFRQYGQTDFIQVPPEYLLSHRCARSLGLSAI